jgi:hypothetical protein
MPAWHKNINVVTKHVQFNNDISYSFIFFVDTVCFVVEVLYTSSWNPPSLVPAFMTGLDRNMNFLQRSK